MVELAMSDVNVVLEWRFSPPDYFEEPISVSRSDYAMVIDKGKVEARIAAAVYDANPSMREVLHERLSSRFLAVQLLSHRPYKLEKPTVTRIHPDGRRDICLEAEPGHLAISTGTVDFKHIDKNGNVISDSGRERIERRKNLAELLSKYRPYDTLLESLLNSYAAGVRDPGNELVHLYEIRDALSKTLGGEDAVRSMLGITSSDWSRFGKLCNYEPLQQGRHRGQNIAGLRDATEAELADARRIALAMIEAYLSNLGTSSGTGGNP